MNGRSGQDWHVANLELSWKAATVLAGGLAVSVPLLRSARRPRVAATARFAQGRDRGRGDLADRVAGAAGRRPAMAPAAGTWAYFGAG